MFYDTINFFAKLSLGKIWNYIKLASGFLFFRLFKIYNNWGNPAGLSIEPTSRCNLKCVGCNNGSDSNINQTGFLKKELFEEILENTGGLLLFLNIYFRGESFLHPDFISLINYSSRKNIYTIVSTNGHFLDGDNAKNIINSGLDRLIISVDGTTQKVYELFRIGGELKKVLFGIKNITEWKKKLNKRKPSIIIQFVVTRFNEHQVKEINKLGRDLGVDRVVIKTAQIFNFERGNLLIPDNEAYSRYLRKSDGTYSIKNKLKNFCWRLWISAVITWDGKVLPCCFDKSAEFEMGNTKKKSMVNIWNSNNYNKFRKNVFGLRKEINICSNCSEGMKVYVKAKRGG